MRKKKSQRIMKDEIAEDFVSLLGSCNILLNRKAKTVLVKLLCFRKFPTPNTTDFFLSTLQYCVVTKEERNFVSFLLLFIRSSVTLKLYFILSISAPFVFRTTARQQASTRKKSYLAKQTDSTTFIIFLFSVCAADAVHCYQISAPHSLLLSSSINE